MHYNRRVAEGGAEFKTGAEQAAFAFVEHLAGDGDAGGEGKGQGQGEGEAEAEADGVGEVAVDATTELARSVRPAFKAELTGIDRAQMLFCLKEAPKERNAGFDIVKGISMT